MLSTLHNVIGSPAAAAGLTDFLVSQTPDKRLGITAIDTTNLKNGIISELAEMCLSEKEKLQFDTYTFEKRRHQWLLGRVCAKQAVLGMIDGSDTGRGLTPLHIAIDVAASGRPLLSAESANLLPVIPEISISHSEHKIIALAADGHCGIDVQVLTDTLFKVKSRFCSEKEDTRLNTAIDDERAQLGLLWTAKEAIRKCFGSFGTIGFLAMELTGIDRTQSCSLLTIQLDQRYAGTDTVTVAASIEDDCSIGACIVRKEADRA